MKIIQRTLMMTALFFITATAFTQCSTKKDESKDMANMTATTVEVQAEPDIVDIAVSNDAFSTLVTAVKTAGLVDALKGDGPFTVFAPTNDAFDKLPEGTISTLLAPENQELLSAILTYHVIPGKLDSTAVMEAITSGGGSATVETLQGGSLTASVVDGSVILTDENGSTSKVTTVDVGASNGVIHIIDTVVLPKQ